MLERVIDRVETVHISDMAEYGRFAPVEIGTGACPIRRVIERLNEYGFDGWYCIEEASGHGIGGIANAYGYAKGSLVLDPTTGIKINTTTHQTTLGDCGVTQSAKDADGYYTITKK